MLRPQLSWLFLAVLGLCSLQVHAAVVTDVSVLDGTNNYVSADAALLSPGVENLQALNALGGAFAGGGWSFMEITDDAPEISAFSDGVFLLMGAVGAPAGGWDLHWQGVTNGLNLDLVVVVRAENQWGAYLFSDMDIDPGPGTISGAFDVSWFPAGPSVPTFNHLAVYARPAVGGGTSIIDEEAPPIETPLPGTLLLIGLALLGLRQLRI